MYFRSQQIMRTLFAIIIIAMCMASANGYLQVGPKVEKDARGYGGVGGTNAKSGQAPWQISLVACDGVCTQKNLSTDYHICGGLIGKRTVITAAHCCDGSSATNLKVRYDGLDRTKLKTTKLLTKINIHPNWNINTIDYDYCILTLETACVESSTVKIIPIANSDPASGQEVSLTGWGLESGSGTLPKQLQFAQMSILPRTECNSLWEYDTQVTDRMICAVSENVSGCNGDSGGPLTYNGTLCGIVSWGANGCPADTRKSPTVYSDPTCSDARSWIIKNTV